MNHHKGCRNFSYSRIFAYLFFFIASAAIMTFALSNDAVMAAGVPASESSQETDQIEEDPYDIQGMTLTEDFSEDELPFGFRKTLVHTRILRGGSNWSAQGIYSNIFDIYGLCYQKPDGSRTFFMADEDRIIHQEIQVLGADGRHYLCMPVDVSMKLRKGFQWTTRDIAGYKVYGWYYDGEGDEFFQIYLRNENQEDSIYQYDTSEKTLQRYHNTSFSDEEYESAYDEAERSAAQVFSRETIVFLVITFLGGAICLAFLLR